MKFELKLKLGDGLNVIHGKYWTHSVKDGMLIINSTSNADSEIFAPVRNVHIFRIYL